MYVWPYKIYSYTVGEVQRYCVQDLDWQKIRKSMKGRPTTTKLDLLEEYYLRNLEQFARDRERFHIQASNYINALKRGGQLNIQREVVK